MPIDIAGLIGTQASAGAPVSGITGSMAESEASAFAALIDLLSGGATSLGGTGNADDAPTNQTLAANSQTVFAGLIDSPAPQDDLLNELAVRIDDLGQKLADGSLTGDELDQALTSLEGLLAQLRQNQASSTAAPANLEPLQDILDKFSNQCAAIADRAPEAASRLDALIEQVRAVSRDAQTSPATPRTPQVSPAAVANAQDGDAPELPVPQTTEQPRSTASQSTTGDSRPVITSTQQGSDTGQFGTNSGNQGQNRDLATHLAAMVATKGDSVSSETLAQSKSESDPALAPQTSQGGRTDALATFRPALAAYNQAAQTINLPQIGFEIARQALNGTNRFQIQLDPPELGRIDVRMDLDRNGSLHARLTVDRSETLDLLQRDARTLERALSQAGLDGSRTSLEFTLRQDTQGRHGGKADDSLADIVDTIGDIDPDDAAPPIIHYRGTASPGGINLWV